MMRYLLRYMLREGLRVWLTLGLAIGAFTAVYTVLILAGVAPDPATYAGFAVAVPILIVREFRGGRKPL